MGVTRISAPDPDVTPIRNPRLLHTLRIIWIVIALLAALMIVSRPQSHSQRYLDF